MVTLWHRRKKSNCKSRQRLDRHGTIAEDALRRIDSLGQNVAIVGGGLVGCELALQLGMTGRTVHLLSRKKEVCRDAAYLYREGLLMELKKVPVKIYNEAECTAITSEGVTVRNADAREYTLLADTVIWAGGYLPMEDEAEQFRTLAYDFWKIGDCAQGGIQCRLKYLNSILRYRESAVILLNLLLSYDKAPGSIYFRVPYRFSVSIVPPSAAGWRRGLAHLASLF